jgi:hypothetical protein
VLNSNRKAPEAGYDLRSLKVHFNSVGEHYPSCTCLGHYKTWEETQDAAAKAANEEVGAESADRILFILPFEKRCYGEPTERLVIEKILDDTDFHTPEKGYNLCYADTFEEFGEQLNIIGHYETYEEALEAQKSMAGSEGYYYIYPAKRRREVEPQ